MVIFCRDEFKAKREAFLREHKRVEPYSATTAKGEPKEPRRPLTEDLNLRERYKSGLISTYNDIVSYFHSVCSDPQSQIEDKIYCQTKTADLRKKLCDSFDALYLEYDFDKYIFATVDIDNIIETAATNLTDSDSSDKSVQSVINATLHDPTENININMAQTPKDFMAMASNTINSKFTGDPIGLDTFIDGIELLERLCEEQNKDLLLKFLMTRMEGRARELMKPAPATTRDIIDRLKASIKTESSKVVEGKILALRAERTNLTKFAERAENLAEEYRRSLCNEGFSVEKAKELSVEKTIELCRKQSRSERIHTIIASTHFTEPKDVIAKMIIEISNLKLDRSEGQNSQTNANKNKFAKKFSNNNFGSSRPNGQNYNNNHGQNRGTNGPNNSNGNRPRYSNNNRNGNNNQNNNYQGQSRTFTNSNYRRTNEQPVRMVQGNSANPGNGGEATSN